MSEAGFERINKLAREQKPFLCLIDFDKLRPLVFPLDEVDPDEILYSINGMSNSVSTCKKDLSKWIKTPVSKDHYHEAFCKVQHHLHYGDSFLLNLTFPTRIETNLSLQEIFYFSRAKYRIWHNNHFVMFSPEPFIKIKDGVISSYPMKGTIRSSEPDASNAILNNPKETEEHLTIVDLIRNDLAMVAREIKVDNYRYLENITTTQAGLLQVSSKITGKVLNKYSSGLGDLLERLLPAGSVTGAPKKKTVEIIRSVEGYKRGYFTGVAGIFDGDSFDSGVMIRFMEQTQEGLIFKSGGGITINSNWKKEYQEMMDKVYVPII